jgi:hypothetical protein
MLNSLDTAQECDARDDEFCTGADFIEQKYVSFRFSVSIGKIQ